MKLCRNVYNNGVMYHAHEPQLWLTSWIICPCINFRFTLYLLNHWKYFYKTLWWCVYCQRKVLRIRIYELSPLFDFGVSQIMGCFTLEPDFWFTRVVSPVLSACHLWWAYSIDLVRRPSSASSSASTILNIFFSETTGWIEAKFHMEP